jgi:WD40 repeat protein
MSAVVGAPPSPYKGLAPFEDSDLDALLFFGRERESEVIAANLMAARITVLYGPSGVGKSSVLRAGVAHRLRQEQEVDVVVFSNWTDDPVAGLSEILGGSGESLVDALKKAAASVRGDLYLILDQVEELFLYHQDGGAFAERLAEVLRSDLRVNVLLGVREDSLARLDVLKASIPNLLANRLRLERLDRLAGGAAITGPISRYNELVPPDEQVEIEPELVTAVLDEVAAGRVEFGVAGRGVVARRADDGRIEAPYLQLVLARLWDVEAERGSQELKLSTLRELGGAERIVEDHLERAMGALSPREKGAAAAMYNFLVTPSGTKIAHGVHDLAGYAAVDEDEAAEVLQRLTSERIVRASSENGPASTRYEIFHDVLADAVLAWRARFEADRRIAEERRAHERRHRRLLAVGGAALLGLAVMAAIAVYAFAQRSNAREQAAAAERALVVAEKERREAERQTEISRQKTRETRRALRRAEAEEREADIARLDALRQEAIAEGNRATAEEFGRLAARARDSERRQALVARRERDRAVRATLASNRRARIIRARELAADARALLMEDSERSVRRSVQAVGAYRRARLAPVAVEDTLRDGLLLMRLRADLSGGGAVRIVRFSPDGSTVLVAGRGGARLYDRARGFSVHRLLPSSRIADAAFSPDGRLVVGAGTGRDTAAHVWDVRTRAELFTLKHQGPVLSVAFSPNGRFIATGSADGTARLWLVEGGLPAGEPFKHQVGARGDDVQMVSFSPDSTRLLTVGGNRFARLFDVVRHEELLRERFNNGTLVNRARFSHDGKLIATAGASEEVRVWNASTGELRFPPLQGTGRVTDLAFSPDDALLATAGSNDTVARVWSIEKRSSVAILTMHRSGVESVAFSPDGRSVATTGRDGKAYLSGSTAGFTQALLAGHTGPVTGVEFSPGGDVVATWSEDGTARLWNAVVGTFGGLPPADAQVLGRHDLPPTARRGPSVAFSPDGRRVLSAGADGTVRLFGPGRRVLTLRHDGPVNAGSFSGDGKTVITASDDGTARIWRVSDGRALAVLEHDNPVTAAKLDRQGQTAVTAGGAGPALLWNVRSRGVSKRLEHGGAVIDVEFSRDGRLVVTAGADGRVTVWQVSGGRKLTLEGHTGEVVAAVFSADGKRLATASEDFTARIWDVRTGDSRELSGHQGALTSLAFNRDGSLLATASADTNVRVWNGRTGAEEETLRAHSGAVTDVAFSADGRWLATAGPLSAGIWETRKRGAAWPAQPIYFIRGSAPPRLDTLAFSPRGWRLVTGWRAGDVRIYNCRLCAGVRQLTQIARDRLREIVRVKR